jgi:hypothetical protein
VRDLSFDSIFERDLTIEVVVVPAQKVCGILILTMESASPPAVEALTPVGMEFADPDCFLVGVCPQHPAVALS